MWTLALVAALALDGSPGLEEQDQVLRTYSLQSLTATGGFQSDAISMLPYQWSSHVFYDIELEDEWSPLVEPEDIVNLIRETVYPAFWDEVEWSIDVTRNSLWVMAPEAVHQQVEQLLSFLNEMFAASGELAIRVYQGPAPDGPVTLNTADADRRIAGATSAGRLELRRVGRVTIAPNRVLKVDSAEVENFPVDWEHEIAQGAFIGEPVLLSIGHGLTAKIKAVPAGGGTQVDLLLRESEPVAEADVRHIRTPSSLNAKAGVVGFSSGVSASVGRVEHPRLGFTSMAGTMFLPDGKALWIRTALETRSGPVEFLIDLRREGPARAATGRHSFQWESPYEEDEEPTRLFVLDAAHIGASTNHGVDVPTPQLDLFDPSAGESWAVSSLTALIDGDERHNLVNMDLLSELMRYHHEVFDEDPRYTIRAINSALLTTAGTEQIESIVDPIRRFTRPAAWYSLTGTLRGPEGQEIGSFQTAGLEGRPLALWSGVQSMGIHDWEVDVANESMVATPDFQALIDGFALRVELNSLPYGASQLTVVGKLNLLQEEPQDVALTATGMEYTRARSHALYINDTRQLESAQAATLEFSDGTLTLELTVSR